MLEFKEEFNKEEFKHQLFNKQTKLRDTNMLLDKVDQELVEPTFQVEVVLELLLQTILLDQSTQPNNNIQPLIILLLIQLAMSQLPTNQLPTLLLTQRPPNNQLLIPLATLLPPINLPPTQQLDT